MSTSLDPLRYGLRALDEMAREQASVAPPSPPRTEQFAPHPVLRSSARDGALLSLRLFTDAEDDATPFVLGDSSARRFAPIPARAASLFETHAAVLAVEGEDTLTIGFPLVTFVQQGSMRAAPLFSRGGGRARWMIGETAWKLPPGARAARETVPLPVPDALVLEVLDDTPYTLHTGVWHFLFGLDGATIGAIAAAASGGIGALVRAATRALENGDADEETNATGPLTREDLAALAEAATRRASPSRVFRCHPHGLAMLPPRGDPTSSLRTDLNSLTETTIPPRGALAVYLGARAAPLSDEAIFTCGKTPPTPSQLMAARAFEGTSDIVAVCGPPGCGKTALLHHVAAQSVLACALGKAWTGVPSRGASWSLVVTSTNNAAVDQALAPFIGASEDTKLPVGLRLGNRRTLAEVTAPALGAFIDELSKPGTMSLDEARAAFEKRAAPVRAYLREREASRSSGIRKLSLEQRSATLREALAAIADAPTPKVDIAALESAETALREHSEAAARLPALHLEGEKSSVGRACNKWARANELRTPRVVPVLEALGLPLPYRELDPADARADITRQREAIDETLAALAKAKAVLEAPRMKSELEAIGAELASLRAGTTPPPPDPGLYDAALAVRDAWARAHRTALLPRLIAARDAARGEGGGRNKPLPLALRELASLFPLVGSTLLSMRGSFTLERDVIDRLVIDEAAQCAPIYAVPALARARRAMFTGDTAQLPPVYTLEPSTDERLARGLSEDAIRPFRMGTASFASAQAVAEPRARTQLRLTEHFRSQHEIVALASRWSGYSLEVRTPMRSLADVSPRLDAPVVAYAVTGSGGRAAEGVVNEAEAALAIDLVSELVADGIVPSDIAVLTPFVGQSVRIERELEKRGLLRAGGVLVSTVHRLQGGERRVVIFSVTATANRHLRWLGKHPHLLHVATSRAQDHLVILFDPDAAAREPALAPLRELVQRTTSTFVS